MSFFFLFSVGNSDLSHCSVGPQVALENEARAAQLKAFLAFNDRHQKSCCFLKQLFFLPIWSKAVTAAINRHDINQAAFKMQGLSGELYFSVMQSYKVNHRKPNQFQAQRCHHNMPSLHERLHVLKFCQEQT